MSKNLKHWFQKTAVSTKKSTDSNSSKSNKKRQHDAAIDELSEALLVQVGKLKEDLQSKIDNLTAEKENYRNALAQSADQIRSLITRLPQETQQ